MKNKYFGIIVLAFIIGLSMVACNSNVNDDDDDIIATGTIQIRINDIPPNIMALRESGDLMIGIGKANSLFSEADIIVGRGTNFDSIYDKYGPDWYQFFIINNEDFNKYIGKEGNYDIAIMDRDSKETWIKRDETLLVNSLNTISFSTFSKYEK